MKKDFNFTAKMLEKVARTGVKVAVDSRCVYLYHQPKMPANLKKNIK